MFFGKACCERFGLKAEHLVVLAGPKVDLFSLFDFLAAAATLLSLAAANLKMKSSSAIARHEMNRGPSSKRRRVSGFHLHPVANESESVSLSLSL